MVEDQMLVNSIAATTVDIHSALHSCLGWLEGFQNVMVAAHNGKWFDFPVLVSPVANMDLLKKFYSCHSTL